MDVAKMHNSAIERIAWVVVVLAAVTAFSYAVSSKLIEYFDYNSQVEIRSEYQTTLPFPRVTICNLNPYRLTALQRNGLFDVVTLSYEHFMAGSTYGTGCVEEFNVLDGICTIPEDAKFKESYAETTIQVCQYLCKELEGAKCSGVLYQTSRRLCTLTSYTGQDKSTSNDTQAMKSNQAGSDCSKDEDTKFFVRKRCTDRTKVTCDFEEGTSCEFSYSMTDTDKFEIVVGNDHTIDGNEGHYAYLMETDLRPGFNAILESDFISPSLTEQNVCVLVAFRLFGDASIAVYTRNEMLEDAKIWDSAESAKNPSSKWQIAYAPVELDGNHKFLIEAKRGSVGISGAALDDVIIKPCSEITSSDCIYNRLGMEYLGRQTHSKSNKICQSWKDSMEFLKNDDYTFLEGEHDIDLAANFCRNPTGSREGPWCFINDQGERESCGIPRCDCKPGWKKCKNQLTCIKSSWVCDGKVHCEDNSDEIDECGDKIHLDCGFQNDFICGYEIKYSGWSRKSIQSGDDSIPDEHIMISQGGYTMNGDSSLLISPLTTFRTAKTMSFYLALAKTASTIITRLDVLILSSNDYPKATIRTYEMQSVGVRSVCIPPGNHRVAFRAVVGQSTLSSVTVTNVTLGEDCSSAMDLRNVNFDFDCKFDNGSCGFASTSSNAEFIWEDLPIELMGHGHTATACGFDTYASSGTIISPGYPTAYGNNLKCVYRIFQAEGCKTNFHFKYFVVEDQHYCVYDKMTIYDGNDIFNHGKTLVLCGGHDEDWEEKSLISNISGSLLYPSNVNPSHNDTLTTVVALEATTHVVTSGETTLRVTSEAATHTVTLQPTTNTMTLEATTNTVESGGTTNTEASKITSTMTAGGSTSTVTSRASTTTTTPRTTAAPANAVIPTPPMGSNTSAHYTLNNIKNLRTLELSYQQIVFDFVSDMSVDEGGYKIEFSRGTCEGDLGGGALLLLPSRELVGGYLLNDLTTPSFSVEGKFCLRSKLYITSSAQMSLVMSYGFSQQSIPLLYVDESNPYDLSPDQKGLGETWQIIAINLPTLFLNTTNHFHIHVEVEQAALRYMMGIAEFRLINGACENNIDIFEPDKSKQSVNCSFEDIMQCGYVDISEGSSKWIRVFQPDHTFTLTSQLDSKEEKPARLMFPQLNAQNNSCLKIHSTLKGTGIALMLYKMNFTGECEMLTKIEGSQILNSGWGFTSIPIPIGSYHLRLDAMGDKARLHISKIEVVIDETCHSIGFLPRDYKYEIYDDDENKLGPPIGGGGSNSTHEEERLIDPVFEGLNPAGKPFSKLLRKLLEEQKVEKLSLTKFMDISSHQINDTILSCKFAGETCNQSWVSTVMTDVGMCLVINDRLAEPLVTTTPGSDMGLHLILNIGAYDQVDGISVNSGLKILLDNDSDVQQMRHDGFEVAAGTHVLAQMMYKEAKLQRAPYGSCGTQDLQYFTEGPYTFNKCEQDCAIKEALRLCDCSTNSVRQDTDECMTSDFLKCILSMSGHENGNCSSCIAECNSVNFHPDISMSALTPEAHSLLPSTLQHSLAIKHNDAQSLRQRTTEENMHSILDAMSSIRSFTIRSLRTANYMFYNTKTSIFVRIERALREFKSNVDADLKGFYSKVFTQKANYNRYIEPLLEGHINDLRKAYHMIHHGAVIANKMNNSFSQPHGPVNITDMMWSHSIKPMLSLFNEGILLLKNTQSISIAVMLSEGINEWAAPILQSVPQYDDKPLYLAADREGCYDALERVNDAINTIAAWLSEASVYAPFYGITVDSYLYPYFQYEEVNITDYLEIKNSEVFHHVSSKAEKSAQDLINATIDTEQCLNEYITTVDKIIHSYQTMDIGLINIGDNINGEELLEFKHIMLELESLYGNFTSNRIDIFEMADKMREVYNSVKDAVEGLQSVLTTQLIQPVHSYLAATSSDVIDYYTSLFSHYDSLNNYVLLTGYGEQIQGHFIWKEPTPDLTGREVIKEAGSTTSVQTMFRHGVRVFWKGTGESFLQRSVNNFFTKIQLDLQAAYQSFISIQNKLVSNVTNFNFDLSKLVMDNLPQNTFVPKNVVKMDIYYKEMNKQTVQQKPAYDMLAFFSDFGGYMGLLLGASVVSIIELLDWCIYRCLFQGKLKDMMSNVKPGPIVYPAPIQQFDLSRAPSRMSTAFLIDREVSMINPGMYPSHRDNSGMPAVG